MKHFNKRQLILILCSSGLLVTATSVMAAAFQLWEQDGATLGNYHAGYAALANDASTAFYNPAGMTRIKNQQVVLGGVAVAIDFKYKGLVTVIEQSPNPRSPFITKTFSDITAQGGNFAFIPALHYVAPITDKLGFGFSIAVPFGLKTDYGTNTPLRYVATRTAISVIDVSPALAFQVTDKASVGAGFDMQKVWAEFNSVGIALLNPKINSDTESKNEATGTGYGYHLGGLYEFTPNTRVGLSYHSQVVHHLSGTSKFVGPIANALNKGYPVTATRSTVNMTLPAYTAFSVYHRLHPQVAIMGSAIYTQWSSFRTLVLNDVAGAAIINMTPFTLAASNTIQIAIPQNYRNTWNISVGSEYYATDRITLRGGVGYDQTPVPNAYRNVQLPDNDRYIVALGGHYQATKTVGVDVAWAHIFTSQVNIAPPPQVMGAQTAITNGTVNGGADVFAGQITWDIV